MKRTLTIVRNQQEILSGLMHTKPSHVMSYIIISSRVARLGCVKKWFVSSLMTVYKSRSIQSGIFSPLYNMRMIQQLHTLESKFVIPLLQLLFHRNKFSRPL